MITATGIVLCIVGLLLMVSMGSRGRYTPTRFDTYFVVPVLTIGAALLLIGVLIHVWKTMP